MLLDAPLLSYSDSLGAIAGAISRGTEHPPNDSSSDAMPEAASTSANAGLAPDFGLRRVM